MQNLRDQLLKAGLINEDQAKKAEKEAPAKQQRPQERAARPERPQRTERPPRAERPERSERPDRPRPFDRGAKQAPIPKLPPLALPNNKEFQRLEAKRQVELDRALRELVTSAQLTFESGEQTFYFVTRKNKLRRMQLPPEIALKLEQGELAVVERPDPGQIEHAVVPAEVAERVLALQEKSVRFFNRKDKPVGFLSDDELNRRQEAEARAVVQSAQAAESGAPAFTPATAPEGAEEAEPQAEPAPAEPTSETESLAANAERAATGVTGEHEGE